MLQTARMVSLLTPPFAPSVDGLRLWSLDPAEVAEDQLATARNWLDPAERRQAARFATAELSRAYLVAHTALRAVVGSVVGRPPADLNWTRAACPGCGAAHGRPTTAGIEFSLSHTPGLIMVATADRPVGVDVERIQLPIEGTAAMLHPAELAEIEAAPMAEAPQRFIRAWTRTEAYLKGIGIGLGREPSLDYLGTDPDPVRRIAGWLVQDIDVPVSFAAAAAIKLTDG